MTSKRPPGSAKTASIRPRTTTPGDRGRERHLHLHRRAVGPLPGQERLLQREPAPRRRPRRRPPRRAARPGRAGAPSRTAAPARRGRRCRDGRTGPGRCGSGRRSERARACGSRRSTTSCDTDRCARNGHLERAVPAGPFVPLGQQQGRPPAATARCGRPVRRPLRRPGDPPDRPIRPGPPGRRPARRAPRPPGRTRPARRTPAAASASGSAIIRRIRSAAAAIAGPALAQRVGRPLRAGDQLGARVGRVRPAAPASTRRPRPHPSGRSRGSRPGTPTGRAAASRRRPTSTPEHSSSRRGRVTATYASLRSSRSSCSRQAWPKAASAPATSFWSCAAEQVQPGSPAESPRSGNGSTPMPIR